MRNMAVLHSPAFSYPLPVLVRVLFNLLIFKGKILYYNKYTERSYGPCCEKTSLLFVFRILEVKLEIKSVVHHPQIGKLLQFATVFLGRTA